MTPTIHRICANVMPPYPANDSAVDEPVELIDRTENERRRVQRDIRESHRQGISREELKRREGRRRK
jgi:hypothetical protein